MKHQLIPFQTVIPLSYQLPSLIYLPSDYGIDPKREWPLILSLHGAAARGDNPNAVLKYDLPRLLEDGVDYPFIVVSPLCPVNTWWSDHLAALDILLKEVSDRYSVDQKRISVTGVGMGGYGVWHLGVTYTERFAALAPVSSGAAWFYGFPERARAIFDTPVWAFHGEMDPIIPLREVTVLVDELKAAGGDVKLSVFPEGGHEIWPQVYQNPDLIYWLLEQRRK